MKTCTQILDSGFRGKINVVNLGDSAKRASPGRRAGPPPCKHPIRAHNSKHNFARAHKTALGGAW